MTDRNDKNRDLYGIDMEATGRRIERAMRECGYGTGSLAELMNVSYQAVYRWIRGKVLPEIQNFYILSLLLGVKIDDLIVETDALDPSLALLRRRALSYSRHLQKIRYCSRKGQSFC